MTNAGDGTLTFTAADHVAVAVRRARERDRPATVTLTADPAGLAPGTYTGDGHVTGPSTTKTVPVTFTVVAPSSAWSARGASTRPPGTTTADASGNGNTGTLNGPVRTTAGRFGCGARLRRRQRLGHRQPTARRCG